MTRRRLPRFRQVKDALPLKLMERDRKILHCLGQFSILDSGQLCRIAEGSPQGTRRRLQRLFHQGYVLRHRQPDGYNHPMAYSIARKGARASGGTYVPNVHGRSYSHLRHQSLVSEIRILLVEHAKGRGQVLFGQEAFPVSVKPVKAFHATVHSQGRSLRIPIIPDLIAKLNFAGTMLTLLIEADRGTMPVRRGSLRQSSILRKVIAYQRLAQSGQLRRLFRSRHILVVFVSESAEREANIRALVGSRFKGFRECAVTSLEHFPELIES